ncbi:MAG: hypothetical protein HGA45_33030, partial [Chloroflexales bacterium]|nr:hypothetical protein [Chloroflexales bacterium]
SVPSLTAAQAYTSTITAQATGGTSPPLAQDHTVTITVIPITRSFRFAPPASEVLTTPAGASVSFTYALTNTGNAVDSFSVAASPTSPLVSPPITSVVTSTPALTSLAPGASAAVTVTYSVPSLTAAQAYTSTITAQATGGTSPPLAQDRVVTINVTGGGAVVIAPGLPSVDPVIPGTVPVTVTFTNIVTNTGNTAAPVTVALATPPPAGWTAQVLSTTCPISPTTLTAGASCTFTVEVVVPAGAAPGAVDLTVSATAYNTPPAIPDVTATAINRVTVSTLRGLDLAPTGLTGTGVEGQVVTFTHTLTNTGNAPDSFDLAVAQSDARWTTTVSPTVVTGLPVGVPRTIEVRAVAGAGILGGATNAITLTATGVDGGPSKSVTDTVALTSISGGDLSPGGRSNVEAGATVGYTFTVTNTGTVAISYTVSLQNSAAGWSAAASGIPTAVLQPGVTATLTVDVTAPIGASPGVTNTTTVQLLAGDGGGAPLDTSEAVTGIGPRRGVLLTPETGSAEGPPGSTVAITHTLTNIGSEAGTFRLFTADVVGWPATVAPDTVILEAGESIEVTVRVRIQDSTRAGNTNYVAVGVELVEDPTINDQAIEQLTVSRVVGLDLSASQSRRVSPGETLSLDNLSVINQGSIYDTYTLIVTGEDSGWDVILGQTSVGVDRGDRASISVRVQVPLTLTSGTVKVLRIEARSSSDATQSDIVQIRLAYVAPPIPQTPPRQKMYLPLAMR